MVKPLAFFTRLNRTSQSQLQPNDDAVRTDNQARSVQEGGVYFLDAPPAQAQRRSVLSISTGNLNHD